MQYGLALEVRPELGAGTRQDIGVVHTQKHIIVGSVPGDLVEEKTWSNFYRFHSVDAVVTDGDGTLRYTINQVITQALRASIIFHDTGRALASISAKPAGNSFLLESGILP